MFCIKTSVSLYFVVLIALLGFILHTFYIKTETSPVIELKDGKIQGIVLKSRGGREFFGFLGIPFARPPVGSLRFKACPVYTNL